MRRLLGALFLVGAVAPHAIAQTDAEFQPLRDWVWTLADATTDASGTSLRVTGQVRSRVTYGDFVLRFEYRVPGPAAGGELLVRSTFDTPAARQSAYAVALTSDRSRGRITAVGETLGDRRHEAPSADAGDRSWVACEVRAEGSVLTVTLDGLDVATADRLEVDGGHLAFRTSGTGALELRRLRIAHVPAAAPGPRTATADGGVVANVGDPGVEPPVIVYRTQAQYTARLMRDKLTGIVRVNAVVGADGVARDFLVLASPHPDFSTQAIASLSQWRFSPATKDGVPVAVRIAAEVSFNLR